MKSLIHFSIFFSVIFISLILQSCGNENLVTAPPNAKNNAKAMSKTSAVTTGSLSAEDTVVTLPLSKVTIAVKKGYPADKLALLDKYLFKHKHLKTIKSSITPNLRDCTTYYDYEWYFQNQYEPASGKYIGIWTSPNVISFSSAHTYGFNMLSAVWSDSANAVNAGFMPGNIMIRLDPFEPISDIDAHGSYGYYYFDEPYENNTPQGNIIAFENEVYSKNPNSKVLISDYFYPIPNGYCQDNGHGIWNTNTIASSNGGIMCDQYYLNDCNGDMKAFWNEYFNYYGGLNKSFMNWMDNTMNNAGGWPSCFDWMNAHAFNRVWLYADNAGDESVIQNFCQYAWSYGWMLRFEKQFLIIWKCSSPSPCTNCDFVQGKGSWSIYDGYYTGATQYGAF